MLVPTLRSMRAFEHLRRRVEAHPFVVDLVSSVLLAVVLAVVSVDVSSFTQAPAPAWALALTLPLAWRRVRPVPSAVAVFGVGLVQVLVGPFLVLPADLVVLVALYSVTRYGPRWAGRVAMGSVVAGAGLLGVRAIFEFGLGEGVSAGTPAGFFIVVSGLATWSFALLRRSREETLVALRDRADRLERERDQQRQLAAADERARIAREMHDVVAHSLSIVIAQADGGRYAAQHDADAAVRALGTISDTGRAALADMRRILGVLRAGPEGHGARSAEVPGVLAGGRSADGARPELAPQPAAGELEPLVEQVRATGVDVSLVRVGDARPLPPGMGLTVYRICQEALTNVLKHAGPDPDVTVVQQWRPDALVLEVTDDGRGAASAVDDDGAGQGLLGMRERAALFGGTLAAGPRPGGGFRVRAELPLPTAERSEAGPPLPATSPTTQELT
ncbi:sensor histidine kinase [Egicoccus halophilus]|uniref:histidine kinase n=1 Tax=Egicoccus halophilus TaxID=1670830 RepID=A0A8J3AA96_9ACTN|nr:sensor histidine kinase [Egicoccus halophilus]GGI08392.1 hypothetical protein GCM10011354_28860 [Egicoccus halophilus]